ncbi:MAG: hypothetical protein AB7V26_00895 [Lysobacterales bacterium]
MNYDWDASKAASNVKKHGKSTKKAKPVAPVPDAMRSEYRRETLGKGVRGKYFKQHG